jgi:hypothetical protein
MIAGAFLQFDWADASDAFDFLSRLRCVEGLCRHLGAWEVALTIADKHLVNMQDRPKFPHLTAYAALLRMALKSEQAIATKDTRLLPDLRVISEAALEAFDNTPESQRHYVLLTHVAVNKLSKLKLFALQVKCFERCVFRSPCDGSLPIFFVDALVCLRRFNKARDLIRRIRKRDPDKIPYLHIKAATIAFEEMRHRDAHGHAHKALSVLPASHRIARTMAMLLCMNTQDGDITATEQFGAGIMRAMNREDPDASLFIGEHQLSYVRVLMARYELKRIQARPAKDICENEIHSLLRTTRNSAGWSRYYYDVHDTCIQIFVQIDRADDAQALRTSMENLEKRRKNILSTMKKEKRRPRRPTKK